MPTTKRLLTDETGQALVTAVNNIVAAVKPNATEIQMSSSDSTSVAQKINNEIATVADGIAIVAEGDVHAAIAKGQFVYVRNHSTLAQGVYKATAAIGTNATLSTSNLTLDNAGGLNDLQAQITTLNSNLDVQLITSAIDLDTMLTTDAKTIKRWRGDNCSILTHAPNSRNIPWQLEVGCLGTNIQYQYQEFRVYQSQSEAGSKVFRRQKYYYGPNDFRWNDWVSIDDNLSSRFFSCAYQGDTTSINIEFPEIRTQMVWLLNVKHYTSSTSMVFDLYVISKATDSTWSATTINSNNTEVGKITSINNSGTTATITFDKNVWVTAQLIRLT